MCSLVSMWSRAAWPPDDDEGGLEADGFAMFFHQVFAADFPDHMLMRSISTSSSPSTVTL